MQPEGPSSDAFLGGKPGKDLGMYGKDPGMYSYNASMEPGMQSVMQLGKGMPPGSGMLAGKGFTGDKGKTVPEVKTVLPAGWKGSEEELEYQRALRRFNPKHGPTSKSIIGVGILAIVVSIFSLTIPYWRKNDFGTPWYPYSRGWGLFNIVGMRGQGLMRFRNKSCRAYGGLKVGNFCLSPICKWYKLKCEIYTDIMWVSFLSGVLKILGLITQGWCLYWTIKLTPRLIRWAGTWWFVAALLELVALVWYVFMTEWLFDSLNQQGVYPEQTLGISFFFSCVAVLSLIICAILGVLLMKIWPEDDEDDLTDSEAEDNMSNMDEHDEDEKTHARYQPPPQPPLSQYQGMQPSQYHTTPPVTFQSSPVMLEQPQFQGMPPPPVEVGPTGAETEGSGSGDFKPNRSTISESDAIKLNES